MKKWDPTPRNVEAECCSVARRGDTCLVSPDGGRAVCISAGEDGQPPAGWVLDEANGRRRSGLGVRIRRVAEVEVDPAEAARRQKRADRALADRKKRELTVEQARDVMVSTLVWLDRHVRPTARGQELDAAYCKAKGVPFDALAQFPWPNSHDEHHKLIDYVAKHADAPRAKIARALPEPGPFIVEPVRGPDGRARNGRWTWLGPQRFDEHAKPVRVMRRLFGAPLPAHWTLGAWPKAKDTGTLVVVEGERKAETMARCTGLAALSVNGIGNFKPDGASVTQLRRDIGSGASKVKRVLLVPDRGTCHGEGKDNERRIIEGWGDAARELFPNAEVVAVTWGETLGPDPDDALRSLDYNGDGLPLEFDSVAWDAYVDSWPWEERKTTGAPNGCEKPNRPRLVPEGAPTCTVNEARDGRVDELFDEVVAWAREKPNPVAVVQIPVGVGKTRVAVDLMVRDPETAIAAPNHKLAEELGERLRIAGADPEHIVGIEKGCIDEQVIENIIKPLGVFPGFRAKVCKGCAFKSECPSQPGPRHLHRPLVLSHDGVDAVGDSVIEGVFETTTLLEGRTLIYDEEVNPIRMTTLAASDVGDVRERPHLYGLRTFNGSPHEDEVQSHGDAALEATSLVEVLERESIDRHNRRLEAAKTDNERKRIAKYPEPMLVTAECLAPIEGALRQLDAWSDSDLAPGPSGETLREGRATEDMFRVVGVTDLWRALASVAGVRGEKAHVQLVPGKDKDGVTIEIRRPRPIPSGSIILDGTGHLTVDALDKANPGKEVRTFALNVQPESDAAPVHALHLQSGRGSYSRRVLCHGRAPAPRATGTVRNISEMAAEFVRSKGHDPASAKFGLITYKPLADALRNDDEFRAAVEAAGFRLDPKLVGHFGRDDRGSNAFEECDVLVVLGDPRAHLGSLWADADALELDRDQFVAANLHATLAQALGRLRAIDPRKTERFLVFAGETTPLGFEDATVMRVGSTEDERAAREVVLVDELTEVLTQTGVLPLALVGSRLQTSAIEVPISSGLQLATLSTRSLKGKVRQRAKQLLADIQAALAADGVETVLEPVPVPGRAARGAETLRLATLTSGEAGKRLDEMVAVTSTGDETLLSTPEAPAEVEVPVGAEKATSREPLQSPQAVPHDAVVVPPTESFQEVPEFALDDPYGKPDEPVARTAPKHVMEEVRAPVRAVLVPPAAREAMAAAIRVAAYVEGVPEEVAAFATRSVPEFVRLAGAPPWQEALARAVHGERELRGPWLERAAREALADAAAVADAEVRLAAGFDPRVTVPAGMAMVALEEVREHQPTLDDLRIAANAETHESAVYQVRLERMRRFRMGLESALHGALKATALPRWSPAQDAEAVAGLSVWTNDVASALERRGFASDANWLYDVAFHMACDRWELADVPRRAFDIVLDQARKEAEKVNEQLVEDFLPLAAVVELSSLPLGPCVEPEADFFEQLRDFNRDTTVSSFPARVVQHLARRALDAAEGLLAGC